MKIEELTGHEKPVLVDFFAEWCGPCQTMDPVLDTLKAHIGETVNIIRIDINQNPVAAKTFKIMSLPTFIFFKNGKEIWRRSGLLTRIELEELLLCSV